MVVAQCLIYLAHFDTACPLYSQVFTLRATISLIKFSAHQNEGASMYHNPIDRCRGNRTKERRKITYRIS